MDYIAVEKTIKRLELLYPNCKVSYDTLMTEIVYNVDGENIDLCSYSQCSGRYEMENGLYNLKKPIK